MKRGPKPAKPIVKITPGSNCPLYRQVYDQLRQAVLERRLPVGARLPSSRALARMLGVSRNTVLNAYEALVADELLAARKGSGTRVATPSAKFPPLAMHLRKPFNLWAALREAHFPVTSVSLRDPDANQLYIHR